MLLLKDAPWNACLRAKCTSKLGALLGLWPGKSVNLDPAHLKMNHDATAPWELRNSKKQQPWCICWRQSSWVLCKQSCPYQISTKQCPMLPGLGKERFSRALQGKAAAALETWNWSEETFQDFIVKQDQQDGPQGNWSWLVHKIFPLDLQLAWFSSCWNPPSLTFMGSAHKIGTCRSQIGTM